VTARAEPDARTAPHQDARRALRAGLVILAVVQTLVGAVALFFPRSFYGHVPGVDLLPSFNEHLMTDVGELSLAVAAALVILVLLPLALLAITRGPLSR
jgi:hypothetical protein